jgi:hypothetical protein
MGGDVLRQAAQRGVDGGVVLVVGAQLKAVLLGNGQGHFENVNRIQAQTVAVQRRVRVDVGSGHVEVERRDHELGHFGKQGGIGDGVCGGGHAS